MSREAMRRAVVQKFNAKYNWKAANIGELKNYLADRNSSREKLEFNAVINALRICDPAVGSGHFLVSALNEIILIKYELGLLVDDQGARLSDYEVTLENDELIVTDENGKIFEYNPLKKESCRIQKTMFHEKQTIIENCLFGVDINPNSVNICRLRLWIELLKNAYYKAPDFTELETLPNIDINIKCGNSLISRYPLDADIKNALRNSKWNVNGYSLAVMAYRNAKSKDDKKAMEKLIEEIKSNFESEVAAGDKRVVRLKNLKDELKTHATQTHIFELSKADKAAWEARLKKLTAEIKKLETTLEEVKNNKIYENAFEWRFEFPEVLNDDGEFVGFDVVIGNPPYIRQEEIKDSKPFLQSQFKLYTGTSDIYIFFIEKGFDILKRQGFFAFIMPNKFMQAGYGKPARGFLLTKNIIEIIDFGDYQIFEKATTYPCILTATNDQPDRTFRTSRISSPDFITDFPDYVSRTQNEISHASLSDETWIVSASKDQALLQKIILKSNKLENYIGEMGKYGLKTGLTEAFVIDKEEAEILIKTNPHYKNHIKPFLLGREVKPYLPAKPSNYLIKFEKGFTRENGGKNPEKWFESQFPEIYKHLEPFEKKAIERTDQGDYYWELRACDYYDKFEKPKIMYQKFQVKPCFIYDAEGFFCNDSMWIIPTDDKVLLGILNSKLGWWLISKYCTAIQNGYQLIWKYFSQIPIVTGDKEIRSALNQKVNDVLEQKKNNSQADTRRLENEIDELVYQLYGLTPEERRLVEGKL